MYIMRSLICVNRLQILSVPHDMIFVDEAVSAHHVSGLSCDVECLAAIVPFHNGNHLRGELVLVLENGHSVHCVEAQSYLGEHIGHFQLLELHAGQGLSELMPVQLVLPSLMEAKLSSTHGAPSYAKPGLVKTAKWSFQALDIQHVLFGYTHVIQHYHACC